MTGIPRLLAPRWLNHLERLRSALDGWSLRVRATLSQVVSDAATKAVREAVQTLTGSSDLDPPARSWSQSSQDCSRDWREPVRSSWSSYGSSTWEPEEQEYRDDEDEIEERPALAPVRSSPAELLPPAHRSRALALGLQTAAWWLRRRAVQFPVRLAFGLGTGAALLAYLAGPAVALGSVGLLGAFLNCCL